MPDPVNANPVVEPAKADPNASPLAWAGEGLTDELKGYIQNRGWKSPADIATSYQNFEKLISFDRAGRTVVLPKDEKDAEGIKAFNAKIGVPATADEYKLEVPKENGSPEFAKAAAAKFHELGLSAKQATDLAKWWNEHSATGQAAAVAENKARWEGEVAQLKTSQGAALEQNSAIVDKAAAQFGVGKEQLEALRSAMGPKAAFEFLLNIGQKLGEHSFEGAQSGSFGGKMTPEQAKAAIAEHRRDVDFVKKYTSGDVAAKKRMSELHQYAYPES